jgi:hypothetical protein
VGDCCTISASRVCLCAIVHNQRHNAQPPKSTQNSKHACKSLVLWAKFDSNHYCNDCSWLQSEKASASIRLRHLPTACFNLAYGSTILCSYCCLIVAIVQFNWENRVHALAARATITYYGSVAESSRVSTHVFVQTSISIVSSMDSGKSDLVTSPSMNSYALRTLPSRLIQPLP